MQAKSKYYTVGGGVAIAAGVLMIVVAVLEFFSEFNAWTVIGIFGVVGVLLVAAGIFFVCSKNQAVLFRFHSVVSIFVLSVSIIVSGIVIYNQIDFMVYSSRYVPLDETAIAASAAQIAARENASTVFITKDMDATFKDSQDFFEAIKPYGNKVVLSYVHLIETNIENKSATVYAYSADNETIYGTFSLSAELEAKIRTLSTSENETDILPADTIMVVQVNEIEDSLFGEPHLKGSVVSVDF